MSTITNTLKFHTGYLVGFFLVAGFIPATAYTYQDYLNRLNQRTQVTAPEESVNRDSGWQKPKENPLTGAQKALSNLEKEISKLSRPQKRITTKSKNVKISPKEIKIRERAFLDTISVMEGTYRGKQYNIKFGGSTFWSYADHPRDCIPFYDPALQKNNCSTAAGRYQFIDKTWDKHVRDLGLNSFSPSNQDLAAINELKQSGVWDALMVGDIDLAIKRAGPVWASFPHNNYKQNPKSVNHIKKTYQRFYRQHQLRSN